MKYYKRAKEVAFGESGGGEATAFCRHFHAAKSEAEACAAYDGPVVECDSAGAFFNAIGKAVPDAFVERLARTTADWFFVQTNEHGSLTVGISDTWVAVNARNVALISDDRVYAELFNAGILGALTGERTTRGGRVLLTGDGNAEWSKE